MKVQSLTHHVKLSVQQNQNDLHVAKRVCY
jgi:hypothetical protein